MAPKTKWFYCIFFFTNRPWDLNDLETIDQEVHQSVVWILENDITECDLDLFFTVNDDVFGHEKVRVQKV